MLKSVKHQVKDTPDNNVYFGVTEKYITNWPLTSIVDSLDIIIGESILNEVYFQMTENIYGA